MKPLYYNDRKAPRMRKAEFSTNVVSKKLWRQFKKEHPEYKSMSWDIFYKTWCEIAETIRNEAITNPLGVKLGSYTGELKLQYLPYKFKAVNHAISEEVGERVNNINLASKGKTGKIKWERRWAVKYNKLLQFFAFEPTRELNRMADKYIAEHPEKLRVARNTLGGKSAWRMIKNKWKKRS